MNDRPGSPAGCDGPEHLTSDRVPRLDRANCQQYLPRRSFAHRPCAGVGDWSVAGDVGAKVDIGRLQTLRCQTSQRAAGQTALAAQLLPLDRFHAVLHSPSD